MIRFHPALASLALILGATTIPAQAASASGADTACPTQRLPSMPRDAFYEGRHDVLQVRALVRDGIVREVDIVSGPRLYAAAIRTAMADYRCRVQPADFLVAQEFEFDASADGNP